MANPTTTTAMPMLPFPHPVLTLIDNEPTALSVKTLKREVYANAAAITTNLGSGGIKLDLDGVQLRKKDRDEVTFSIGGGGEIYRLERMISVRSVSR